MEQKIENLWHSFRRPLWLYVHKSVPISADTDDIVQDIYLKISQHSTTLEGSHIRSYLYTTAKHAVADYYRAKRKKEDQSFPEFGIQDSSASQELTLLTHQLLDRCLLPMIETLPKEYADALKAVELDGVSQKEFAKNLGISYSGAKSRVQRGRLMLRKLIEASCHYLFDKYGNVSGLPEGCTSPCKNNNECASFLQ